MHGRVKEAETDNSGRPEIHMYNTLYPQTLTLQGSQMNRSWFFVTSISHTKSQAVKLYDIAMDLAHSGNGLYDCHVEAWEEKWKVGCINIKGSLDLSKAIYASMYYILSSLPPLIVSGKDFQFFGLSPGSLATGGRTHDDDYNGHVFWDMETWMYPPILVFFPSLARKMLLYRVRNLDAAKENATRHGYKGAMFPWESAYSGHEVCPGRVYADYEQHITGDIALAIQQYLYVTGDKDFLLQDGGWDLVINIAEFWASRVEWDDMKEKYVIKGVMPPDEYHRYVDNSVYTNVVARISLNLPLFAGKLVGQIDKVSSQWIDIANKLYIPFDETNQYHPEFDGFTPETTVKQADVILLGYPLMYPMTPEVRHNDLSNYDNVTDQWGPAMTWSMFTIGWLELAQYQKAHDVFQRCYANIQQPFKTWTEIADGSGAYNFITGMGGFLQTIVFGYGGIRIHPDLLELNPVLPLTTNELSFTGIQYLGSSFNVVVKETDMTITMTTRTKFAPKLTLVVKEKPEDILEGVPYKLERGRICIRQICQT
ncbi:protein-glucosylgalactosylhydroxylysine glucosidase-like [Glandiceps talaboti]